MFGMQVCVCVHVCACSCVHVYEKERRKTGCAGIRSWLNTQKAPLPWKLRRKAFFSPTNSLLYLAEYKEKRLHGCSQNRNSVMTENKTFKQSQRCQLRNIANGSTVVMVEVRERYDHQCRCRTQRCLSSLLSPNALVKIMETVLIHACWSCESGQLNESCCM